jgi:hypothetical protein
LLYSITSRITSALASRANFESTNIAAKFSPSPSLTIKRFKAHIVPLFPLILLKEPAYEVFFSDIMLKRDVASFEMAFRDEVGDWNTSIISVTWNGSPYDVEAMYTPGLGVTLMGLTFNGDSQPMIGAFATDSEPLGQPTKKAASTQSPADCTCPVASDGPFLRAQL